MDGARRIRVRLGPGAAPTIRRMSAHLPSGTADPDAARELARELLGDLGNRWEHTRAVAAQAARAAAAVPPGQGPALRAAAWLHDIGYAAPLHDTGFHPLDGARFLQARGWDPLVVGLVAQHSGARFVAEVRGLRAQLDAFGDPAFVLGALPDALTYADQTISADGHVVDVQTRHADMLRRHGPDSPSVRCHALRGPVLRAAVARTEARLVQRLPPPRPRDAPARVDRSA